MILDEALYETLGDWVRKHYREELSPNDLGDPSLMDESIASLDQLSGILGLGTDFYPFQR